MTLPPTSSPCARDDGFTLIEVLVALAIVTCAAVGLADLVTVAVTSGQASRALTSCTALAVQKMEQLESLTWTFDGDDATAPPLGDTSTDLGADPPSGGGPGLSPGPADSLDRNVAGYVDYLDAAGRSVGAGAAPPASAVFVRRWSVAPLPSDAADSLVLQVLVTRVAVEQRLSLTAGVRRLPLSGDAWLSTVMTRREP